MFTIKIQFDPATGHIDVEGPMNDGVLYLGMLDIARVVFLDQRKKPAGDDGKRRIVAPLIASKV